MNATDLNTVLVAETRSVAAVSRVRARITGQPAAGKASVPLTPSGDRLQQLDTLVVEVEIGVLADLSAAATALAVEQTVNRVLSQQRTPSSNVLIRVVSIGS